MGGIVKGIGKIFKAVGHFVKKYWKAIAIAVVAYFTCGLALAAMAPAATTAATVGATATEGAFTAAAMDAGAAAAEGTLGAAEAASAAAISTSAEAAAGASLDTALAASAATDVGAGAAAAAEGGAVLGGAADAGAAIGADAAGAAGGGLADAAGAAASEFVPDYAGAAAAGATDAAAPAVADFGAGAAEGAGATTADLGPTSFASQSAADQSGQFLSADQSAAPTAEDFTGGAPGTEGGQPSAMTSEDQVAAQEQGALQPQPPSTGAEQAGQEAYQPYQAPGTAADTTASSSFPGPYGADTTASTPSMFSRTVGKVGDFWHGMSGSDKAMFVGTMFKGIAGLLAPGPTRAQQGLWPGGAYFGMDEKGKGVNLAQTYKDAWGSNYNPLNPDSPPAQISTGHIDTGDTSQASASVSGQPGAQTQQQPGQQQQQQGPQGSNEFIPTGSAAQQSSAATNQQASALAQANQRNADFLQSTMQRLSPNALANRSF